MAEYIDREAWKKYLNEEDFGTPDERWRPESEFAQMIEAIPTADVVEVVRCKECKYWVEEKEFGMLCSHWGSALAESQPDDFCSYGERKGGEG